MRVVLFSRVPRWYSFRKDRLVHRLTDNGHEVVAVVVEKTKTLASVWEWFNKFGPRIFAQKAIRKGLRLTGREHETETFDASSSYARKVNPPVYVLDSHNSPACVELVRALCPDVIVLRGCGIVKKPILDIPRLGTINPHYALLPAYRGMDVTEWAALHGDPIAVSVHNVEEGVDTGAVLALCPVGVQTGDTVGALREKSAVLVVDLIAQVLASIETKTTRPTPQQPAAGRQYFTMHPRLRRLADERLKSTGGKAVSATHSVK